MSNVATASAARSTRVTPVALALAVAAVAVWIVAGLWADELFLVGALVGGAAAILGEKARREARREGSPPRLAVVAIVVGGLVAAQVAGYSLVWAIGELV